MFKKVLVAEDLGSINHGIAHILDDRTGIREVQQAQYCDDAYLKCRRALQDHKPFDLLITDLSFKESHRERKLISGTQLIEAVKKMQPDIKVIIYSMEDRSQKVKSYFSEIGIDGYVCKGRYGLNELVQAVIDIYNGKSYVNGLTQEQIGDYFKRQHISPNSTSSIEKRLNKLKYNFKAKNAIHLVAMTKDLGLL